jgi:hypothetical protein
MPFRLAFAAVLLSALLVTPVLAKSHGQILSSGGPYSAAAKPGADIPALCKQIVAKQQSSKQAMADAANLYFHGTLMGQKCVPVDYVKAITLMKASGHTGEYNGLVHALKARAASGNALAVAAVAKLKL